ncbi:aldehyde dehydrogenase family protein [Lacimicrobium alkaliphilum]|uniref:Aldehyde dehydrogenase n=1 Tax=Lacimicrobium alkaliphilum TaxID=1526571 RepID=A0A0U3B432_9ALTE|nr:aldehyde dehydrogenase family protein [Lacimicrobium alkaliphilum]ALS99824.1 aldehyde dehydrogenase [Lacimicrobium alkaliphilum]
MQTAMIAPAVQQLYEYFSGGTTRSIAWRKQQLNNLQQMIDDSEQAIFEALREDLGKAEQESWLSEVGYLQTDIRHSLRHLSKWSSPRKVSTPVVAQPGKSYLQPEPLGTVLIIGAWNYPFQLLLAPLVAAISAGNCAVLKPSELAPATSKLLATLLPRYLDSKAFLVVQGAVEETTELLRQPFDHILYTGGEAVGKIVMRAAAEHLTPVTLELGGKSPCIVAGDCDLDVAAARIVWSKWMNAGQTCVAPDYILTEKGFSGPLMSALQKQLTAFYGTDPATSPDYGRIINQRHFQRLQECLSDQRVSFGGQTNPAERYMAPTLVLDPPLKSKLMQEEIFGPILPVISLEKIDDAIPFINNRPKPLALYLYTENQAFEQQVLTRTSAGSVCINDGMMFMANPQLPFGGVGNSGMGRYHGQWGFDTFSHLKAVMKRSNWFDINWRYPPFSAAKLKKLKWVS